MARVPYNVAPKYDIDALLDVDLAVPHASFRQLQTICDAIWYVPQSEGVEHFRPDSSMLFAEIVVRDLCAFDVTMGNGWAASLGYSNGLIWFYRGLRALRAIQHVRGLAMAELVLSALQREGIPQVTTFPDDPLYGSCDEWDLAGLRKYTWDVEQRLSQALGPNGSDLDSQWWDISHSYWVRRDRFDPSDPPVDYAACEYLSKQRELLRCRR